MANILSASCGVVRFVRLLGASSSSIGSFTRAFKISVKLKGTKLSYKVARQDSSVPDEIRDDPKFVPLKEDDPGYGTTALLLVGFQEDEIHKVEDLLKNMDADFVRVIRFDKKMLGFKLWDCMHCEQQHPDKLQVVKGLPQICFISGMTGEEIMTIVHSFPEIGLEDVAFAALVPNNADTVLELLIEEVMGDHELLKTRRGSP